MCRGWRASGIFTLTLFQRSMKTLHLHAALVLSLIVLSFKGPEGDPGPEGNANVRTYDLTTSSSGWVKVGTAGNSGYGYKAVWSMASYNYNFETDLLMVYLDRGTSIIALPYTLHLETNTYSYDRTFTYKANNAQLSIEVYDSDFQTKNPSTLNYKIIIAKGMTGKTNIDWSNYNNALQQLHEMSGNQGLS
jgi:hypothetical protein